MGDLLTSVEDSGSGIVAGTLERIFDPMFTTKSDDRLSLDPRLAVRRQRMCAPAAGLRAASDDRTARPPPRRDAEQRGASDHCTGNGCASNESTVRFEQWQQR
jgi:hypothetical protein